MIRLLSSICLLSSAVALAAPPEATHLFPAGAQRGTTTTISVGGKVERWPLQVWTDRPDLRVEVLKEKGSLRITTAADARPGPCWLRLHDEQGASPLRPFLLGTLPELSEQEPNDDPKKPQSLAALPILVNGQLDRRGDVDGFSVALSKGQTLIASLEANRTLGSPMDSVMQIVSAAGFVLAHNHDSHGLDPQIEFTAPADGRYVVRVFAFPAEPDTTISFAGAPGYVYRLTLTTGAFVDHVLPLAVPRPGTGPVELFGWNIPPALKRLPLVPGPESALLVHADLANVVSVRLDDLTPSLEQEPNSVQKPQFLAWPSAVSGRIDPPGDEDVFEFALKKGQPALWQIQARAIDSPLTPVLRLLDEDGKTLTRAEGGPGLDDPSLSFTAPRDGRFRVAVSELYNDGGMRFVYRLRAAPPVPDFELTVAADRFTLLADKPLDITVTVEKRHGFAEDVLVEALDLPMGVTVPAVLAKGGGKVNVTLRFTMKPGGTGGPIRLVGRAAGRERLARAALPAQHTTTPFLWLNTTAPAKPAKK